MLRVLHSFVIRFIMYTFMFSRARFFGASALLASAAFASFPHDHAFELQPVEAIAASEHPLRLVIDPRAPAQPLPAQDGAEALRSVPGFNVIRKGGTDGDPVLRGMAGSRLGILLDGENLLGGCANRMDPPTAYVFPVSYDSVTILKGPQTVLYGAGHSAGIVLFDRDIPHYPHPMTELWGRLTFGSFGRNDQFGEVRAGMPQGSIGFTGTRTASNDFKDGDGRRVHAHYERWSAHATAAWTPAEKTLIALSSILSDGEAAYADRMMDGAAFRRNNLSLRVQHAPAESALSQIDARLYYNYVDHVMDNYSLRAFVPSMMMPHRTASNPDRETIGGRIIFRIAPQDALKVIPGIDFQLNRHTSRGVADAQMANLSAQPRIRDAAFETYGVFSEAAYDLSETQRVIAGARLDRWHARDSRDLASIGMMQTAPNPTAGQGRQSVLPSAFLRYEQDWRPGASVTVGIGHTQRFPDYWELFNKESRASLSAFHTDPERTTQLDLGSQYETGNFTATASLFASRIEDFILIESDYPKDGGMMGGTRGATVTRNVDAKTYGGELGLFWTPGDGWRADAALAWVRGTNDTDRRPLAQQPPLEMRLALSRVWNRWSAGSVFRWADRQDRVALGQGSIVGQDLGPTPSFATVAIHGSWHPIDGVQFTAGVDNLFDRTYAEHLSRGGATVAGFPPPTIRVNEPGRTFWIQLDWRY